MKVPTRPAPGREVGRDVDAARVGNHRPAIASPSHGTHSSPCLNFPSSCEPVRSFPRAQTFPAYYLAYAIKLAFSVLTKSTGMRPRLNDTPGAGISAAQDAAEVDVASVGVRHRRPPKGPAGIHPAGARWWGERGK